MKWINCGFKFPENWQTSIIRKIGTRVLITEQAVKSAEPDYFLMEDGESIYYKNCQWLDESDPWLNESNLLPPEDWEEVLWLVLVSDIASYYNGTENKRVRFVDVDVYAPEIIERFRPIFTITRKQEEGKEAADFAEWANERYTWVQGDFWHNDKYECYSTQELFQLFKDDGRRQG